MSEDALVERLAEATGCRHHADPSIAICVTDGHRARPWPCFARAVLPIVEDYAKAERRAEQDRAAIDAQAGYTSVQQNADEGWSRIEALQPLREAIESKFTEGSHAVLLAVRDSQWVKDIRKAERKAGAVDALREAERIAKTSWLSSGAESIGRYRARLEAS